MPPRTPNYQWVRSKLERLTSHADEIRSVDAEVVNEIGPWAALKLFHLMVTTDLYTRIIENVDSIDSKFYFDVLAGSGTVVLDDYDTSSIGSPLIAATVPEHPFDRLYFFEGDEERASALRERLDFVDAETPLEIHRDRCIVIDGDSNETVPEVVQELFDNGEHQGLNHLSFIDNERMEVQWDTIRELSKIYGDFLINFQTKGVSRELGYLGDQDAPLARKTEAYRKLDAFFGGPDFRSCSDSDELIQLYESNLASIGEEYGKQRNNRSKQRSIQVQGAGGRYYYRLIYATRETGGGSPYIEFVDNLRSRIESMDGNDIETAIEILQGDTASLDMFEVSEEEMDRDEDQSTLDKSWP